jgi:hypothetical protein
MGIAAVEDIVGGVLAALARNHDAPVQIHHVCRIHKLWANQGHLDLLAGKAPRAGKGHPLFCKAVSESCHGWIFIIAGERVSP